jgi:enoyl-CoA hydratase/carnithine racemase
MELAEYQNRYKTAEVSRDDAGVLTIRMHSRGGPLMWGGLPHQELPELFMAIASDRENQVVVLTGTGDTFIGLPDGPNALAEGRANATVWDRIIWEGNRLVDQMLDIEVPMIAAVNGPVSVHSELAVLCDVVLAADHTYFQDAPHFPGGLVPGDSMQIVWPLLLGPNRGRYFLLTGQQIYATEAKELGIVGEVVSPDELLPRAQAIASDLAQLNPVLLRNTRHALVRPLRRAMADDLHTGLALEAIASMSAREWNRDREES